MTTERPLVRPPLTDSSASANDSESSEAGNPGARLLRLRRRQRLFREEMLAVLVLLLALAATVAVLATQWLGSAPNVNGSGSRPAPAYTHQLGGTT
jgi:hypothetical protein